MNTNLKIYYRQLLKAASSINNYNFKQFAIRKIKNDFKYNKVNDISYLQSQLEQLKRIQTITQLYCINHHMFTK